jgi:hypothetical protein
MHTLALLVAGFFLYCFMLWGMTSGAGAGPTDRRADNIGFLIFAIVTYSLAVGGGVTIASFYM